VPGESGRRVNRVYVVRNSDMLTLRVRPRKSERDTRARVNGSTGVNGGRRATVVLHREKRRIEDTTDGKRLYVFLRQRPSTVLRLASLAVIAFVIPARPVVRQKYGSTTPHFSSYIHIGWSRGVLCMRRSRDDGGQKIYVFTRGVIESSTVPHQLPLLSSRRPKRT